MKKTREAANRNYLLNFEDLTVLLWQPGEEVYIVMRRRSVFLNINC